MRRVWLSVGLLSLGGCASLGEPGSPVNPVAWADDDSALALVLPVEQAPGKGEQPSWQLYTQQPDGSARQPLGVPRNQPVSQLYYMKQAGYLVLASPLPAGGLRFDWVSNKGKEITIIETRQAAHQFCTEQKPAQAPVMEQLILPAPDGKLLANVYSQGCGEVTLEFMQPQDLATLNSHNLVLTQTATATWHPDGYLVIAAADGKQAWQVGPEQAPTPTAYPKCLSPATRSSAIAADGRRAVLRDGVVKIEPGDPAQAFGCQ